MRLLTAKLYALINELELKNLELEGKLQARAAQSSSAEVIAQLHATIQALETQLHRKDGEREDLIQQLQLKLDHQAKALAEINSRPSAEPSQAQPSETLFKGAQSNDETTNLAPEEAPLQVTAPTLPAELPSEDLKIKCQSLSQSNARLQAELAEALEALRLNGETGARPTEAELPSSAGLKKELEGERDALAQSLAEARDQSSAELTRLRDENDRLNAEKGTAEEALAHSRPATLEEKDASRTLAQQLEVEGMGDQLATLQRRLEEGEQVQALLKREIDELKHKAQGYRDELEATQLDLKEKDAEGQIENLRQELHHQAQSLREALTACAQKEKALEAAQSEVSRLEKLNHDSEIGISQLSQEKEELQLGVEKIQTDHAQTTKDLEAKVQRLTEAHLKDRAHQSTLEEQIKVLSTKDATQRSEIQHLQETIGKVTELARAHEELAKSSQQTLDEMKAEAEGKQALLSESEAKLRELESQLVETCGASDSAPQKILDEICELKHQNESANRAACSLQEQLFGSQEDLKARARELYVVTEELAALKKANAQLTSKVNSLTDELSTTKAATAQRLQDEKSLLTDALETRKDELEALKLKETQLLKAYQELTTAFEATRELANQAQSSLEGLRAENAKLVEAQAVYTQTSKQDLASAQKKLAALEGERVQLEQRISQLESQESLAEGKATQLQEALASLEARSAAEAERLASELERKTSALSDLQQQVADQAAILAAERAARAPIEQLKASLASLTKELAEKAAHSDALQKRLDDTLAAMATLQTKAAQLDATLVRMEELQLNLTAAESSAREAIELRDRLEASHQQLEIANKSLEALTAKCEQQVALMAEQQKQLDDYSTSVEKLTGSNQSLSSEKMALAEENDQLINNLASIKAAVKAKLKDIEGENSRLMKHTAALEASHAELNHAYEAAQTKLQATDKDRLKLQSQVKALTLAGQADREELERLHQQLDQASLSRETFASETSFQRQELEARIQTLEELLAVEQMSSREAATASAKTCADLERALADLDALRQDYTAAQASLASLQMVLEELQGAQSAEVDFAVEKLRREAEARAQRITELEYRAALAETKLSDHSQRARRAEARADEMQEQAAEASRLKDQVVRLNDQNLELTRRLRKLGSSEDLISREFVGGLFTRFASFPRGDPRKYEMLEVISAALRLTPEDQVEVGLVREAGLAHDYASLRARGQTQATVTSPPSNPARASEPPNLQATESTRVSAYPFLRPERGYHRAPLIGGDGV
ncbi:hypothetical protein L0F63_004179 [Massospora cicadina]|nr:hypothetical protein L0F63_004179 [Massospora cicadina]